MSNEVEKPTEGHARILARLVWAMVGPLLLISLLTPLAHAEQWFTGWELAYAITVAFMIWARFVEQKSGHGTTLYSQPSTWSDFRHYVVKLIVVALLLWVLAKTGVRYLFSII